MECTEEKNKEFTEKKYRKLLEKRQNELLTKSEKEKYELFANKDPFPEIKEALLNANDVAKYAITTGMLSPFIPENLSGVTYTACFSGKVYYWDADGKERHEELKDDQEYTLKSNSIAYLQIDTFFRVPNYIVLRYNLRVKNVYKGLLLGTGPIVDSGYIGQFFIPLHNLTSNEYVIKKGAKLIEIEFTKLSIHPDWIIGEKEKLKRTIQRLDFSDIPPLSNDFRSEKRDRPFSEYVESALIRDPAFYNKTKELFVSSSVQQLRNKVEKSISESQRLNQDVKKTQDEVKEAFDRAEHRENMIKSFSILTIIAMLLTAITLGITAASYFYQNRQLELSYQDLLWITENNEATIIDILDKIDVSSDNMENPDKIVSQSENTIKQIKSESEQLCILREELLQKQEKRLYVFGAICIIVLVVMALWFSMRLKQLEKKMDKKLEKYIEDNQRNGR